MSPKSLLNRRWLKTILFLVCVATLVVALRGFLLANMMNGAYHFSSLLFDSAAAFILIGLLQLSDVTAGLRKSIGNRTKSKRIASKMIRFAVIIPVAGTFLLSTVQLHPPKIRCTQTPADKGLEYSEHRIKTNDGLELAVWKIPASYDDRPVVVLAHGLGANKQNFLPIARMLQRIGYNVVAFDFRAHGDSDGLTCSLGVLEAADVKAAFDFAAREYPARPIFAWSTSMGGAATLRAANRYRIFDKIVVDATFTNVRNVAMETKFGYLGPLGRPAWQLCRCWYALWTGRDIDNYGPINDIGHINHCPILLIHGTADRMIPYSESEKLQREQPNAQLWLVPSAGHGGAIQDGRYPRQLYDFYESK